MLHCPFLSGPQLMEIESLLTDEYELIDWRRFLLSAALPWPFPSLTQLLVVLQRFKAADTGYTGYINEEQYLQVSLFIAYVALLYTETLFLQAGLSSSQYDNTLGIY